jgi:hypothetical protein
MTRLRYSASELRIFLGVHRVSAVNVLSPTLLLQPSQETRLMSITVAARVSLVLGLTASVLPLTR